MPETPLRDRLAEVQAQIAEGQRRGGWSHPVQLIGVTKTHGPEVVRAAVAAGITAVGENRVQEALAKQEACGDLRVDWHLIGPLQRNKVRHASGRFTLIHTVDREELAIELDQRAGAAGQSVLVQVNCSGEAQKSGIDPDRLPHLLEALLPLGRLRVRGLMTMAALTGDASEQRRAFGLLRELRDTMASAGHDLPELSMGMSSDYAVAVEEGATMIRLGSVLFGART